MSLNSKCQCNLPSCDSTYAMQLADNLVLSDGRAVGRRRNNLGPGDGQSVARAGAALRAAGHLQFSSPPSWRPPYSPLPGSRTHFLFFYFLTKPKVEPCRFDSRMPRAGGPEGIKFDTESRLRAVCLLAGQRQDKPQKNFVRRLTPVEPLNHFNGESCHDSRAPTAVVTSAKLQEVLRGL